MRTFKIIDHNLHDYQHKYNWITHSYESKEILPGHKVNSRNKLSSMGIVTEVGPKVPEDEYNGEIKEYVDKVTVLWLTGPHKGKREIKDTSVLSSFDSYKAAIQEHLDELTGIEIRASQTGM